MPLRGRSEKHADQAMVNTGKASQQTKNKPNSDKKPSKQKNEF